MMYAIYQHFYDPEGWWSVTRLFRYITLRTAYSAITSGLICWMLARVLIPRFKEWKLTLSSHRKQLDFHENKSGTPTMGGLFIVISVCVSSFLWSDLTNRFICMVLFVIISLGLLGAVDDWFQVRYENGHGLAMKTKLLVQGLIGLSLGLWLVQEPMPIRLLWINDSYRFSLSQSLFLPFLKSVWIPLGWLYVPFVMVVVVGSSNAVNLTDGLDGLAIGCVLMVTIAYVALSYITGHFVFSEYLQVPNIKGTSELATITASMVGAGLGFLWYNAFPAEVFMGDAGSLALGGALGTVAVLIKQEILLVLVGGIFVVEALSVMIQVISFKLTGNRPFEMAPLHHHFELKGIEESKITIRFWIVGISLVLLALSTLKLR